MVFLMLPAGDKIIDIIETHIVPLTNPIMIVGITGPGAVGSIAAQHIIEELQMVEIAHVQSALIPPITIFIDGLLRHPFRLFADLKGRVIVALCEIPLPNDISFYIAQSLTSWAQSKSVSDVIILDGIPDETDSEPKMVLGAAEPDVLKKLSDFKITPVQKGLISGLRAAILNQCLTLNLSGMIFFVPVVPNIPDPLGASYLIEKINQIYGLQMSIKGLEKKEEEIQKKLRTITEDAAKMENQPPAKNLHYLV